MSAELVPEPGRDATAFMSSPAAQRVRYALGVAVLALLYYGSAKLGYALDFSGPVAAIVWLPVGVGISFLYLGGLRFWPGVLLGDLLANDYTALPLGSALGQTTGNVLEMLAATMLIRWFVRRGSPLGSVRALFGLLIALAIGTLVSATVGGVSLRLGGVTAPDDVVQVWRTWWLGDFTGALVVVPLAIAWSRRARADHWEGKPLEAVAVLVVVAVLTDLAFMSDAPITYIVFPALMWAALRFGQRGATLAVTIAAALTVWDTTHYSGPFAFDSITRSVLATQLYIAVAALTALCLAAVVSERELFARRLQASRLRLIEAGDTERRRLEHDLHDGAQQRLTALAVRLDRSAEDVREDPRDAAELFEEAAVEVSLAIDELRQLARGLHPAVLSHLGLGSAVRDVALRSGVPITVAAVPGDRLGETAESTGYFVFAEAVTNAQKHARAERITVRIIVVGGSLRVEVSDDGVGGATESSGYGLVGLRDRVEAVGGWFAVDSPAGRGTRVYASIPLTATPARTAR
jgi:signal transduction histidine kinase